MKWQIVTVALALTLACETARAQVTLHVEDNEGLDARAVAIAQVERMGQPATSSALPRGQQPADAPPVIPARRDGQRAPTPPIVVLPDIALPVAARPAVALPDVALPDVALPNVMQPAVVQPSGQQRPAGPPRAVTPTPLPTPTTPSAPTPRLRGRDVNVQIEITLADQAGAAAAEKRVVSMLVADGTFGRIRSNAAGGAVVLNIDATPTLLSDERILLQLTMEYTPAPTEGASRRPAELNEMISVILQNGKPVQVSQAVDPQTDRRMTVDVRASIVR